MSKKDFIKVQINVWIVFILDDRSATSSSETRQSAFVSPAVEPLRIAAVTVGDLHTRRGAKREADSTVEEGTVEKDRSLRLAASVCPRALTSCRRLVLGRVIDQRSDPRDTPCNFLGASPLSNSSAMIKSHPSAMSSFRGKRGEGLRRPIDDV